jgi:hypothetical protein
LVGSGHGGGRAVGCVCAVACAGSNACLLFRYAQSDFVLGFAISIFESSAVRLKPLRIFSFEECLCVLALGGTTMLGALLGFGSYESPFYYKNHVTTMSMAIFGTAVFCLTIFGQVHRLSEAES